MAVSFLKAGAVALICLNAIGVTAAPVVSCVDDFPSANVAINGDFETSVLGSIAPWSVVSTNIYSGAFIKDLYQCKSQWCYFASPGYGGYGGAEYLSLEMTTVKGHTYDLTGQTAGENNNCTVKFIVGDSLAKGKVIAAKIHLNAETLSSFANVAGSYKATSTKTTLWIEVKCALNGSTRRGVIIDNIKFVDRGRSKVCTTPTITQKPPATTTAAVPPKLTCEWDYLGCYPIYHGHARRVLIDAAMTNEKCHAACAEEGYTFAGTYYGNECYCGEALDEWGYTPDLGPLVNTDRFCTFKCPGNASQLCGSNRAWNMYRKSKRCLTTTTSKTATPTTSKSATPTIECPTTTTSATSRPTTTTSATSRPTTTTSATSRPTTTSRLTTTTSPASPTPTKKITTLPFQWGPKKFFYWQRS